MNATLKKKETRYPKSLAGGEQRPVFTCERLEAGMRGFLMRPRVQGTHQKGL
jgi:hypothetical protein